MICALCRWRISRSLDRRVALPANVAAHVRACPACSAFHARVQGLDRALFRQAAAPADARSELSARIRVRLGNEAEPTPSVGRAPRPHAAWATAAALLCVLALTWHVTHTPSPLPPSPALAGGGQDRAAANPEGEPDLSAYTRQAESVAETVTQAIADPFADEHARLAHDAESAGRYLLACLSGEP